MVHAVAALCAWFAAGFYFGFLARAKLPAGNCQINVIRGVTLPDPNDPRWVAETCPISPDWSKHKFVLGQVSVHLDCQGYYGDVMVGGAMLMGRNGRAATRYGRAVELAYIERKATALLLEE